MLIAVLKNFTVYKNADWSESKRFKKADGTGHDLTGTHLKMQVRRALKGEGSDEVIIELSDANGRIVYADQAVPDTKGTWSIEVDEELCEQLPGGEFPYDLIWTRGALSSKVMQGTVAIEEGATRQ